MSQQSPDGPQSALPLPSDALRLMLPILIVDDSTSDLQLTSYVLDRCKVQNPVIQLKGGQACIDYFHGVNRYHDRRVPALVLLDMRMAPISGTDVLREVHAGSSAKGSIFVMLSGLSDMKVIQEGYQLGAVTFLVKPLSAANAVQMLDKIKGIQASWVENGYVLKLHELR